MPSDRHEQIERGMQRAADRPQIMPDDADARIRPVYEDIQRSLRVPFVNLIFRTLANDPDYLVPAWRQLSPVVRTRAFERAADDLRSQGLVQPAPEHSPGEWDGIEDLDQLRAFNDTIHYVLPKLLLVATALDEGGFGGAEEAGRSGDGDETSEIPLGVAEGTTKVKMIDPGEASGRVHELFESIKERHGHPLVSSYYRALGNWPDFLGTVWSRIEPRVGSEAYERRKHTLVESAGAHVRELPRAELSPGETLAEAKRDEIRAILAAFRRKFIPEMLLDVVWIKAMLDGAEAATSSPFSA